MRQYASAGAIVVAGDPDQPQVLLLDQVRVTGQRQTVAPKGRLEAGEAPLAAALREVTEESGLSRLGYAGYLGQDRYEFVDRDDQPAAKTVDWFLCTTPETTTQVRREEGFTAARWVDLRHAATVISHPGFAVYLDRAADLLAWRRRSPVPCSAVLDRVIRDAATGAAQLLAGEPLAGIAVCGSAARGDFVEGWSDLDLIGYGLPAASATVAALTTLTRDLQARHGVRISLHFADPHGRDLAGDGPLRDLHDRKLQTALARIGIDTAVIAGAAPGPDQGAGSPDARPPAGFPRSDLVALRDLAAGSLATAAAGDAPGGEQARRALSAAYSAARAVAVGIDPQVPLRVPVVATLIAARWPGHPMSTLLRDYDAFRQRGLPEIAGATALAERVPDAITALADPGTSVIGASGGGGAADR